MKIPPKAIKTWVAANFNYKERKDELLICSPFKYDTKYKFNISPELGLCHDWRGDSWAGPPSSVTGKRNCSFIRFVQLYRNCSYYEALKEVVGSGYIIESHTKPEKKDDKVTDVSLPESARLLSTAVDNSYNTSFIRKAKNYLHNRGVNDSQIKEHRIYYDVFDIIWPYYEYDEVVYWQSRSTMRKMFSFPKNTNKSDYIYGFDLVEPASYLIIVESIFGVHTLGAQTIASGGASIQGGQYKKIKLIGPKEGIILAPDLDKAGLDSITSNYNLFKDKYKIYYSIPPIIEINGELLKDWNELYTEAKMSFDEIRKVMEEQIKPVDGKELLKIAKYANQLGKARS